MKYIFCLDPGSDCSGIAYLSEGAITYADNIPNEAVVDKIEALRCSNDDFIVLVEDIAPYTLKLKQEVIDTCKFIGETLYRLRMARIDYRLILRWQIKQWVYNSFNEKIKGRIEKKIAASDLKDGKSRRSHFVFVDDRIVLAAMKYRWGIETPKPGKRNSLGLSKDAWQALALGTFFIDSLNTK